MNKKYVNTLFKGLIIIILVVIIDFLGVAFLALKTVSIPFVPNRNIDKMSDYYTALWEKVRGNSVDNGRFVIIDISDCSRSDITKILKTVSNMNPKIIGLDVSFISQGDTYEDSLLVHTIQSTPNIVLPVEYLDKVKGREVFNYSVFHNQLMDKEYGVVSFPNNRDVIRLFTPSFCIGNQSIDAFAYVIAEKCNKNLSAIDLQKEMIINYTTLRLNDDEELPCFQLLEMNERDSLSLYSQICDKIVLIGATKHTSDQHLTPLGSSLSGVMIHAHIINSLMDNKVIKTTPLIIRYVLCLVVALLAVMRHKRRNQSVGKGKSIGKTIILWCFLFLISVILFAGIGTILFCNYSYYIDFSPYIVTLIIAHLLKDKTFNII